MFFKKIIIKSFTYNQNIHIAISSFQADTSRLPKINT